jgi:hypothetical protein
MVVNPTQFDDNIPESPGGSPVGLLGIYLLLGYVLLLILVIFYSLVKVWPPIPENEKPGNENTNVSTPAGGNVDGGGGQKPNTDSNRGGNGNGNLNAAGSNNSKSGSTGNTNAGTNTNAGAGSSNTDQPPPVNSNASTNTNTNTNTNAGANAAGNSNANVKTTSGGAVAHSEQCLDDQGKVRKGMAPVSFFWSGDTCIYDEDRLLLIVALAGALGALVHVVRSLSWYIGQRKLYKSWTAMYFLLPFLGAATALVFYLVVRGGFFSSTVAVKDTNPFGFAALAALIGMFTDQALQRLKTVAENILMPAPAGKESAPPASGLSLTNINPSSGPSTGGTPVAITGNGFVSGARVNFGGVPATTVEVKSSSAITATTPAHAAGTVDVEVINPNNQKALLGGKYTYQ